MKVSLEATTCTVIREEGDIKFYNTGWGTGESRLLYHVKNI